MLEDFFIKVNQFHYQTVHCKTPVMEKAMGRTEDEMLQYWTGHFPRFVIQVYESDRISGTNKNKKL